MSFLGEGESLLLIMRYMVIRLGMRVGRGRGKNLSKFGHKPPKKITKKSENVHLYILLYVSCAFRM